MYLFYLSVLGQSVFVSSDESLGVGGTEETTH